MALFVKSEMFETLSKLSVDDLRVVEQMVSFYLFRDRDVKTLPVDVQRYELTIGEDYERWLKETQGKRDSVPPLQHIASQVPITNQGNFLVAVACPGRIYIGNACESSVADVEQLVESLIARKEEIEHV